LGCGVFGLVFFFFLCSFWHCSETEYTGGFKSIAENTENIFFKSQAKLSNC